MLIRERTNAGTIRRRVTRVMISPTNVKPSAAMSIARASAGLDHDRDNTGTMANPEKSGTAPARSVAPLVGAGAGSGSGCGAVGPSPLIGGAGYPFPSIGGAG